MKRLMLFLLVGMFFLSFASAVEVYQKDTEVDLKVVCLNDGFCSGSGFCNFSVFNPQGTAIVSNGQMQNQNAFHNYTLNSANTSHVGEYQVVGFCNDGAAYQEIDFTFQVTPSGKENTLTSMIMYVFMLVFLIFTMPFTLWAARKVPQKNPTDEIGQAVGLSYIKYLRIPLYWLVFVELLAIFYILGTIGLTYLPDALMGNLFFTVFTLMMKGLYILIPVTVVYLMVNLLRDKELQMLIKNGVIGGTEYRQKKY